MKSAVSDAQVRGVFRAAQAHDPHRPRPATGRAIRCFKSRPADHGHVGHGRHRAGLSRGLRPASLAETLPQKIERLLAGENLAQQELDAYEQQRSRTTSSNCPKRWSKPPSETDDRSPKSLRRPADRVTSPFGCASRDLRDSRWRDSWRAVGRPAALTADGPAVFGKLVAASRHSAGGMCGPCP